LCGYYVCEFITAYIRRTPEDVLRVRIYQFFYLFLNEYIYIYTNTFPFISNARLNG
jgi:hypothetical protein